MEILVEHTLKLRLMFIRAGTIGKFGGPECRRALHPQTRVITMFITPPYRSTECSSSPLVVPSWSV